MISKKDVPLVLGKRKASIARVKMVLGKGDFSINGRDYSEYLKRKSVISDVLRPFSVTGTLGKYDVSVNVYGGGLSGQAGAIRYAISRALKEENPSFIGILREYGFLTRDSRVVERKMYGHKKSRRSFQFSKR